MSPGMSPAWLLALDTSLLLFAEDKPYSEQLADAPLGTTDTKKLQVATAIARHQTPCM